jgi:23S rRNA G2069 N7-methylase RlmK/C1962 C5-methylase RlmI
MALAGAKKVVGLDINHELVDFAQEYLRGNYPQLVDVIEFKGHDLRDYDEVVFDTLSPKTHLSISLS